MKLEIQKILLAFALPLLLLFILYTLRTMESVMNWDFITWGIYPRETKGIMGIFTSPLIHADWGHLFANTFPLLFLLWCLLYFYRDLGIGILFFIWIVSGILTFIIGKPKAPNNRNFSLTRKRKTTAVIRKTKKSLRIRTKKKRMTKSIFPPP